MAGSSKTKTPADGNLTEGQVKELAELLQGLDVEIVKLELRSLSKLTKNARYMTGVQHRQLVDNIKRDGCLTSVPLVYELDESEGGPRTDILSGNHRVTAALEAGIAEAYCMRITTRIDEERRVAIQLAHNAVEGQDDPSVLRDLYDSLGLDMKAYSGLTDDSFGKLDGIDLDSLAIAQPKYEEVAFFFLPHEADPLKELMDKLKNRQPRGPRYAVALEQYDQFFDLVLATKKELNIISGTVAFQAVIDLAQERLDQLAAEREAAEAEAEKTSDTEPLAE